MDSVTLNDTKYTIDEATTRYECCNIIGGLYNNTQINNLVESYKAKHNYKGHRIWGYPSSLMFF